MSWFSSQSIFSFTNLWWQVLTMKLSSLNGLIYTPIYSTIIRTDKQNVFNTIYHYKPKGGLYSMYMKLPKLQIFYPTYSTTTNAFITTPPPPPPPNISPLHHLQYIDHLYHHLLHHPHLLPPLPSSSSFSVYFLFPLLLYLCLHHHHLLHHHLPLHHHLHLYHHHNINLFHHHLHHYHLLQLLHHPHLLPPAHPSPPSYVYFLLLTLNGQILVEDKFNLG